MKYAFAIAVLALLAWIGFNIQQRENRVTEARHERAVQAQQYLDCLSHAKYPDLCTAPE